jgi:hypothetical protein
LYYLTVILIFYEICVFNIPKIDALLLLIFILFRIILILKYVYFLLNYIILINNLLFFNNFRRYIWRWNCLYTKFGSVFISNFINTNFNHFRSWSFISFFFFSFLCLSYIITRYFNRYLYVFRYIIFQLNLLFKIGILINF